MKNDINKLVSKFLIISLVMSICFIAGIPGIVLSAISLKISKLFALLLAVSIAAVAVGFYVMPIMWIQYGSSIKKRNIITSIEQDGLRDISSLSRIFDVRVKEMYNIVLNLIQKRYITDLVISPDGTKLVPNQAKDAMLLEEKRKNLKNAVKCPYCGAMITFEGLQTVCMYCGNVLGEKPKY